MKSPEKTGNANRNIPKQPEDLGAGTGETAAKRFERSFGIDPNDARWQIDQQHIQEIRQKLQKETTQNDAAEHLALGDFQDLAVEDGRIVLNREQNRALLSQEEVFFEEVKDSRVATTKGYQVAAAYDAKVQGWTTRSKIMTLSDGKQVFALCNYPQSWKRRMLDRTMEWLSGDRMRKPRPKDWKKTVESRSNVPIVAGTPENMVVMPYIESLNANDLFSHQKDIKDFGPFDWADQMPVEERLALLGPVAGELARVHQNGKTWGEAILPNVVFTKDRKPILVDPETTYEKISVAEQRATDLRNLVTSTCGALARAEGFEDFQKVAAAILEGYNDPSIEDELLHVVERPLSLRQKFFFNLFNRFRIGASDLNEFQKTRAAIAAVIRKRKASSPA